MNRLVIGLHNKGSRKTDRRTGQIVSGLVNELLSMTPMSPENVNKVVDIVDKGLYHKHYYDICFSFGDYITDRVWHFNPRLSIKPFGDEFWDKYGIHIWDMTTSTGPFIHLDEAIRRVENGGTLGQMFTNMRVQDYVKFFGNYMIPKMFGENYWINCIEREDEKFPQLLRIVWDVRHDHEEIYVEDRGYMLEVDDTIEDMVRVAVKIVVLLMRIQYSSLSGMRMYENCSLDKETIDQISKFDYKKSDPDDMFVPIPALVRDNIIKNNTSLVSEAIQSAYSRSLK